MFTASSAGGGGGTGATSVSFILTQTGTYSMALSLTETHTSDGSTLAASPYQLVVTPDQSAAGKRFPILVDILTCVFAGVCVCVYACAYVLCICCVRRTQRNNPGVGTDKIAAVVVHLIGIFRFPKRDHDAIQNIWIPPIQRIDIVGI